MDNVDKLCAFVGILLLVSIVAYPVALFGSEQQQEITIDEKWTKQHGNGNMKYLVSDTDGNVYSIDDCHLYLRWDASNRYANIDEGKTYDVVLIGWRVPILSWYQNIIEIAED
jgi:hypothetical protein